MRTRGFTLIELLVVVVILGVLAAALVLSTAGSGERRLEREAERLRALIAYACEQSELTGRDIGVSFDRGGYRFSEYDRDSWIAFSEGELRARAWIAGTAALLSRDGHPVEVAEAYPDKPQLVCFSSGELTPFRLELALGEVESTFRLDGTPDGAVAIATVRGHAR